MSTSPMMQQYLDAKAACPEALLLFRMGDFYELFFDDAKAASRLLNLALTSRDKGDDPIPMAGFPHHQLESYLNKLIAAGQRVAVCDQVEDARFAKGLVKREVTRIVTPGTVTDDALLDPRQCNYLAAVFPAAEAVGLAWVELSTGRFLAAEVAPQRLADELARIAPTECLASEEAEPVAALNGRIVVTQRPAWTFSRTTAERTLAVHFGTQSLDGFGFSGDSPRAVQAAGAILSYLQETQRASLAHIDRLVPYRPTDSLRIDESTRRSLEITRTLREGRREGSLLAAIDQTVSAMGSRLLSDWLANPLADKSAIDDRLDTVAELVRQPALVAEIRDDLRRVYDLERLIARITIGRASPRDLSFLARTLRLLPAIKARLAGRASRLLGELDERLDLCAEIRAPLDGALEEDCPLVSRDGGFIRQGYNAELDSLRELAAGGKQWIAEYQVRESARAGIPNLKVGFNKVFGYYLEVTNAHTAKIPAEYIRKQTVKNAERYITPELKEYEQKVLTADERSKDLECELFLALRSSVAASAARLQASARVLASLDCLTALAELARRHGYCRPMLVDEPILRIVDGRHPVLDQLLPAGTFVPNDLTAGDTERILLITGPNMAGKSTYIRQAALIVVLAQMGSFVPAEEATIGLADQVFARVGATDELAKNQSTFMVEMTEAARILNTATSRSLVILDEIGRGTSTYDGVSLAWAIVEHLHDSVGCRTLFATHYHELTNLAESLAGVKNLNVAVREWQEDVVFLHKIVEGAADKSYGIHVARLAGVPREVIEQAKEILVRLEDQHLDDAGRSRLARKTPSDRPIQLTLFGGEHPIVEEIKSLDLDSMTPLAALERLNRWKEQLSGKGGSMGPPRSGAGQ